MSASIRSKKKMGESMKSPLLLLGALILLFLVPMYLTTPDQDQIGLCADITNMTKEDCLFEMTR